MKENKPTFIKQVEEESPYTGPEIATRLNWTRQRYQRYRLHNSFPFDSLESLRVAAGIKEDKFYSIVKRYSLSDEGKD